MNYGEKKACKKLLKSSDLEHVNEVENLERESATMAELLTKKKRKRSNDADEYIECNFITGNVAEAERLWSQAKHVTNDLRKYTSPVIVEAMIFLNSNLSYWNGQTIKAAMARSRSSRVQRAIEDDVTHSEM